MDKDFLVAPLSGKTLAATDATGRVALHATGRRLVISNLGPDHAYITLGGSTVTSAAASHDFCIPPFQTWKIHRDETNQTYLAAICDAGDTAAIRACTGWEYA